MKCNNFNPFFVCPFCGWLIYEKFVKRILLLKKETGQLILGFILWVGKYKYKEETVQINFKVLNFFKKQEGNLLNL